MSRIGVALLSPRRYPRRLRQHVARTMPSLSHLTNDRVLLSLFAYWERCRNERVMPHRRDIDPVDIERFVLPHLVLAEYVDGGARIRYRLVGTGMVARFGIDFTGRHTDEIMTGSYLAFINGLFREVREHQSPIYSESCFRWDAGGFRRTRRIFLPLGDDDVRMVLIGQTFDAPTTRGGQPEVVMLSRPHRMEEVTRAVVRRAR